MAVEPLGVIQRDLSSPAAQEAQRLVHRDAREPGQRRVGAHPIGMMNQPSPSELARVLDHVVAGPHIQAHDLPSRRGARLR